MKSIAIEHAALPQPEHVFVGRTVEQKEIQRQHQKAIPFGSNSVLITGPGGIGKTALIESYLSTLPDSFRVLWSRTWTGAPQNPYWAVTQIIRNLLEDTSQTNLASLFFESPEEASEFDLYENIRDLLTRRAQRQPLVIIFDNIQEADVSSIALIEYLLQALENNNIFILATATVVEEQFMRSFLRRIELSPLEISEVQHFYHETVPEREFDDHELSALYSATGGIPLLMVQLDIDIEGDQYSLESAPLWNVLTAFMRYRFSLKSLDERLLLTSLAVLGSANYPVLAAMTDIDSNRIQQIFSSDRFVTLIQHDEAQDLIHYSQELIRNAVLDLCTKSERRKLHYKASTVLARFDVSSLEIATHLYASGPEHRFAAAEQYYHSALSAGRSLAGHDSLTLLEKANDIVSFLTDIHAKQLSVNIRCRLMKLLWQHGKYAKSEHIWDSAWQDALILNNPDILGLAAMGPRVGIDFSGSLAPKNFERAQYVLNNVSALNVTIRAKLTAIASLSSLAFDPSLAPDYAKQALQLAQQSDEPVAVGYALTALAASDLGPDTLQERLQYSREILSLASRTSTRDLVPPGWFLLLSSLVENADFDQLSIELRESAPLTLRFTELKDGRHALWYSAAKATIIGDVKTTEALLNQARTIALEANDPDSLGVWAAQLSLLHWLKHDLKEVTPLLVQAITMYPQDAVWKAAHAWMNSVEGNVVTARGILSTIGDPSDLLVDRNWLSTINFIAETAVNIRDLALGQACFRLLTPYAGRVVSLGLGVTFWGTVDRTLALLNKFFGNIAEAKHHYYESINLLAKIGAKPWLAIAQTEYAELLLEDWARAAEHSTKPLTQPEEAQSMLLEAQRLCQDKLWPAICSHIERVFETYSLMPSQKSTETTTLALPEIQDGIRVNIFGKFSVIDASGQQVTWNSKRARTLLKVLIAHRGRRVHRSEILDSVWPSVAHSELSNRLSVALTALRRGFDPERAKPTQYYLQFDGEYLWLNLPEFVIDAEVFIRLGLHGLQQDSLESVEEALELFEGVAFSDEFDALWAEELQEETLHLFRDLVEFSAKRTNPAKASELFRALIAIDEYYIPAHEGLVSALTSLGANHQATAAQARLNSLLDDLSM